MEILILLAVIALVLSLGFYGYQWYVQQQKRDFIVIAGVGIALLSGVSLSTIALFLLILFLISRMM